MTPVLRCDGLGHRYGRSTWGLRDATLQVPPGRVVALVGPNGSGKTTLLHMAAGLLPPTVGTVQVAGAAPTRRLDRIGFVAQDAPLWPRMRVAEVLEVGRRLNPRFDAALAAERTARLEIPPRARISTLSGGQRAQVALTLVLAKRPDLLLLDEPLANLDPLARREFLSAMFEACTDSGAAVLFSSHVVAELERICDHLIVLRGGRVRLAGDIDDLRQSHRIITGPTGWPDNGGWRVINAWSAAGRTTALVHSEATTAGPGGAGPGRTGPRLTGPRLTGPRLTGPRLTGPGLDEAQPTFDELVLGYLDEQRPSHQGAVA